MRKSKLELIPKHFKSAEDAGDFWDSHDLADYWDKTKEVALKFHLRKKHFYIAISPQLAKELHKVSDNNRDKIFFSQGSQSHRERRF